MKNRHEKIVLEAEKGITFEVSEGTSGELIIRAQNIMAAANVYSENYVNPPIPEGYKHVLGGWEEGFVIERCTDGSQFGWIPVGYLDPDGTLDGEHFCEKFGRRNYLNDTFSAKGFNEPLEGELLETWESIKKYGGFYISCYEISCDQDRIPKSVKGFRPCLNIDWFVAEKYAKTFGDGKTSQSHLPFGAEYDSVLAWFIKSGAKTTSEISKNSESHQKRYENNIYDFASNVGEWTAERFREGFCHVARGGMFDGRGGNRPVAYRLPCNPGGWYIDVGFRATLYVK